MVNRKNNQGRHANLAGPTTFFSEKRPSPSLQNAVLILLRKHGAAVVTKDAEALPPWEYSPSRQDLMILGAA